MHFESYTKLNAVVLQQLLSGFNFTVCVRTYEKHDMQWKSSFAAYGR